MTPYMIEALGVALTIVGCVVYVAHKDGGRKSWRAVGLALTALGSLIILNF